MKKFSDKSYNAKRNAQQNLYGLTHWADDDKLMFFSCHISSAFDAADGLIFCIKYSQDAGGFHGGKEYGAIVFDLHGNRVHELRAESAKKRDKEANILFKQCETYADLITRTAIESQIKALEREISYLNEDLKEFVE